MEKTRPIKRLISTLLDRHPLHKASIISIQDPTPKQPPAIEESLIMVDYFHPSSEQKSKLEEYLENKKKSSAQ
jgi:hypothetical protein